jgi:hypothetical protein
VLTVAPKLWRPDQRHVLKVDAWPQQRHHGLLLFETDRLHITAADPEPLHTLNACLRIARRADPDGATWDSSLIAPDVSPAAKHLLDPRQPAEDDTVTVTSLLLLFERLKLLAPRVDDLTGIPRRFPLHRPLLYRRFLDEVQARLNSARRGYRPVAVTRTSVRGRIDPASALRYTLTADPRLTCYYDELTESTILLGIIATALEWIADGHGLRSPFDGRYSRLHLRHDAVTLRRALDGVGVLQPRRAIAAGTSLRLNRLDQPWSIALHQSLAILAEIEHSAHHDGLRLVDPVELSVPTDILWERIVHQVLTHSGFDPVLDPAAQPADLVVDPWLPDTPVRKPKTRPDNVAWQGSAMWVVDAKYKDPPPKAAPERDDQYQMFAYSHLVVAPGSTVRHVALVYPGQAPTRSWRRGRDTQNPRRLIVTRIPFPSPEQARSDAAWRKYIADAAGAFAAVVASQSAVRR